MPRRPFLLPPLSSLPASPPLPSPFSTMDAAIAKLTSLGFAEDDIRHTIYEILQAYDDDAVMGWRFTQENNYRMVVSMLEYKRMKENEEENKCVRNDAPCNVDEYDARPTKCFGMDSDEDDDED